MPRRLPRRLLAIVAMAGMLLGMPGGVLASRLTWGPPAASALSAPRAYASLERITEPDEVGVARPAGVAWNARTKLLSVFDLARPGRGIEITPAGAPMGAISGAATGTLAGPDADLARAAIGGTLRGLAIDPASGHLFTYAPSTGTLWELDAGGEPVAQRDLSGAGLDDVRAIAIAPSADTTDAADRTSAYIADAGVVVDGDAIGGGLYEIVLSAPVVNATLIAAATSNVTLVNTINTGAGSATWTPDSPDPSGLAYNPSTDRLVAVDGEVEESTGAGFHGANGWFATRTGTTTGTFNTVPASPSNKEPVGAAYDPVRDELYICKDGSSSTVWVYNASSMALVRSFSVAGAPYNNSDAEGLAIGNGILYMADAIDNDMVKVQPGPNGVIGTGGDDIVSNHDLQQYGQSEPEGLDVDPSTGNIWIVSNKVGGSGPDPMLEVTPDGALVSSVSIAAANPNSAGGLAVAPPSDGTAGFNIYIADRGVDNNEQPSENDGRIYEFATDDTPPPPPPPPPPPGEKLTNVGFELDADGDTRPDAWTTNTAFTRSSASAHDGTFSGRHSSTSNGGYNVYQQVNGITAGTTYAFSGWINIPITLDTFTLEIQMKWRGSDGLIASETIVSRTTTTLGLWAQVSGDALAPPGATSVRVTMKLKSLNATIYVDDFSLVG